MKLGLRKGLNILLLLVTIFFLFTTRYPFFLEAPTSDFLSSSGDGLKNYVTPMYHIKHGTNFVDFQGMNYPYGEHVLFSDNQPIFSASLLFLKSFFPSIVYYVPSLIHWSMLASLLFAGLLILLIFRKFNIPDWFGILATIGITLLVPQNVRMGGHFGLAHAFVIPLFFYLLLLFEETKKYKYIIILSIAGIIVGQLHFYFFGIYLLLTASYIFFRIIFSAKNKQLWKETTWLSGILFITFATMQLWVMSSHVMENRPSDPYGFLVYSSNLEGIFLNKKAPVLSFIDKYLIKFKKTSSEGKSYIGIIPLILFIILFGRFIKNKMKVRFFKEIEEHNLFLRALFATSLVLGILFAVGFPFVIPPLEKLIQYLGPLKQLRSIGRFAWIFFYTANIFGFIYIYKVVIKDAPKSTLYFIVPLLFLFNFSDGFIQLDQKELKLRDVSEFSKEFTKSEDYYFSKVNPDEYQAILPIPYFHIGSENFDFHQNGISFISTSSAGFWSGLPSMGVMMSRTDLKQSLKSLSFAFSNGYRVPKLLDDLPSKKPILIFVDKHSIDSKRKYFDNLINHSPLVFENKKTALHRLDISVFEKMVAKNRAKYLSEIDSISLFKINDIQSTDSVSNFIYENYNNLSQERTYLGEGSFMGTDKKYTLFQGQLPEHKKGKKYNISFWVYIGEQLNSSTDYFIQEIDKSGKQIKQIRHSVRGGDIALFDNDWAFIEYDLVLDSDQSTVKIDFKNPMTEKFYIDELLIRPVEVNLYQNDSKIVWKNNRYYKK